MHFGFNGGDSNKNISEDIELLLEGGIDDVTEFLGGFGDNSFEKSEEATGFVKFCRAEGGFGRFFVGGCEDGDGPFTFELVVVVLFTNLIKV